MSRRAVHINKRLTDSGSAPISGYFHQKSPTSPLLSIGLVLLGAFLLIAYAYSGPGGLLGTNGNTLGQIEGLSCASEVQRAIPILMEVYGDNMHKILHVGPETCQVVSHLLKVKGGVEAWGIEPYDVEDADANCKSLMYRGIVRIADIKFPLPYKSKSFSLVIVSDSLDYLSPKYLNQTLPELTRVASDGLVIFAGYPRPQRYKDAKPAILGRTVKLRGPSWWNRYFIQIGLKENESAVKKFDEASIRRSFQPSCQVFHLNSYQ